MFEQRYHVFATPALTYPGLVKIAEMSQADYTFVYLSTDVPADLHTRALPRMLERLTQCRPALAYSDFLLNGSHYRLGRWMEGSVRDDFEFGPLLAIRTRLLKEYVETESAGYESLDSHTWEMARQYHFMLWLPTRGPVLHIAEPLYTATLPQGKSQFDYQDRRNKQQQYAAEIAFTRHLLDIGAWIDRPEGEVNQDSEASVEASVVIPVKNRNSTIADAVRSALSQHTSFNFNVLVVDNNSTDGTTDTLRELAQRDPRLIHIIPDQEGLGIGGCWNVALNHPLCGRHAVQLDSDDLYSDPRVLERIIGVFHRDNCAMVVGSYQLVDFNLNQIPPGVIDHREWSESNGHNNLLRVNGIGAPRAFKSHIARAIGFPNVSYGEDYAMALAISRRWRISRIFDVLYLCRRWEGNSDASLDREQINANNLYKDTLRANEIAERIMINDCRGAILP